MKAKEIMTSPVITVGPETTVRQIAAVLLEHRICAVPVVKEGRVVGMVSEADLLHRHEIGTDRIAAGRWWLRLFGADRSPAACVKSHTRRARDVMTHEVVSVAEDTQVAEIATLLATRRIERVPVLRGERLVGVVNRANLVRALAVKDDAAKAAKPGDDHAIRARLLAELARQPWWQLRSNVDLAEGVVQYRGICELEEECDAARVAAENVPGVRGVENRRIRIYDVPSMV